MQFLLAIAVFSVLTHASPVLEGRIDARATCKIDTILSIIKKPALNSIASSFCSKYIQATSTFTSTQVALSVSTTIKPGPSTTVQTTITSTGFTTATLTATTVPVNPTTTVTTIVTTTLPALEKRAVATPPALYVAFAGVAASRVSSVCSCLVTPPALTVTSTLNTKSTSVSISTGPGVTTSTTATSIVTQTSTATITTTAPPANTNTVTTTLTSTTSNPPLPSCTPAYQAILNPSFELYHSRGYSNFYPLSWDLTETGNGFTGAIAEAQDGARGMYFGGDPTVYTVTMNQPVIHLCPGKKYTFSFYVGTYNGGIPNNPNDARVTVSLGGVTIVPAFTPCGKPGNSCDVPVRNGYGLDVEGYKRYTVTGVSPGSGTPNLAITVVINTPQGVQSYNVFIDNVTLTQE